MLGFLYFMFAAINLPTIAVLLGISIVCMILVRAFWEDKKFIRILVRVVSLTFILGVLILVAVTGIMGLSSLGNNASSLEKEYIFQQVAVLLCAFFQSVLLGFCPALAMAYLRGHGWDIMALRIVSVVELVVAVCTALFTYRYDAIQLSIDNLYFSIFFVLCVAVTTVLTFLVFPPFAKKKGLLAQPKKAAALSAEPEAAPEEEPPRRPNPFSGIWGTKSPSRLRRRSAAPRTRISLAAGKASKAGPLSDIKNRQAVRGLSVACFCFIRPSAGFPRCAAG